MRIGLIDVDSSNFPNLALMKLGAWHKQNGDDVEWYSHFADRYDIVYKSKVFSFSPDFNEVINADKVVKGGTGYDISVVNGREVFTPSTPLPMEVEHIMPDYSLYGITDTAYGFLSRGCPRGCSFCHVAPKEGKKTYKVADLSEFWNGQKNIVLCDPNILACPQHEDLLQQLADSRAWVDLNQGLDIRLMTERKIELLNKIKIKEIHFAWDNYHDKDIVLPKFKLYSELGKFKPHSHNAIVYVLTNFNSTVEQDLERIYTLRELGYWAYIMVYDKQHCAPIYKQLQCWCNNRFIYSQCPRFEDYDRRKKYPIHENQLSLQI
jgi:hypothetical protein